MQRYGPKNSLEKLRTGAEIAAAPRTELACLVAMMALFWSGEVWSSGSSAFGSSDDARAPETLSEADWAQLRSLHRGQRHAAVAVDGGFEAWNIGQQWRVDFDGRSFRTAPASQEWRWGLALHSYGRGRQQCVVEVPESIEAEGGRVSYRWNDLLTEWHINDARGLEHGFTVRERPMADGAEQASEPLRFIIAVHGGLRPQVQPNGRDVAFLDSDGVCQVRYDGLTVFDADGVALEAHFASIRLDSSIPFRGSTEVPTEHGERDALLLLIDDAAARYPVTIDPIAQQAYLKPSNAQTGDQFGNAVAVSGSTVVVGAWLEDSNATGVNGNQANNSLENAGAAYVFVRNGSTWTQQAYLKASNTGLQDAFGFSVAISGDTIVVGAPLEDSNATGVNGNQASNAFPDAGAAYVFVRSGTTWSQQAYLKASNSDPGDQFGFSVAISGETIVVGGPLEDSNTTAINGNQANNSALNAGAAYVFVRSGSTWSQQAYLKPFNTDAGDQFGQQVAIDGDTAVVGAIFEDSNAVGVNGNGADNTQISSGAAYVFVRNGTTWSQQAYLKASNTQAGDRFGEAVGVSGDIVVVGAPFEDSDSSLANGDQTSNNLADSGAAYVFGRSGSAWVQQAYLKAPIARAQSNYGNAVAVEGGLVAVAARLEGTNSTGVSGPQGNFLAEQSGAAYLYARVGSAWCSVAFFKASNTGTDDVFGTSIAMAEGILVVGAPGEDSISPIINGDQGNNLATNAGAAYVFLVQLSADCNSNGIPDELELRLNDCNFDGIPDDCQQGVVCCSGDLDGNGVIDGADLGLLLAAWGLAP